MTRLVAHTRSGRPIPGPATLPTDAAVLAHLPVPILLVDHEDLVGWCNTEAERLLGVTAARLCGRPLSDFLALRTDLPPGADQRRHPRAAGALLTAAGTVIPCEVVIAAVAPGSRWRSVTLLNRTGETRRRTAESHRLTGQVAAREETMRWAEHQLRNLVAGLLGPLRLLHDAPAMSVAHRDRLLALATQGGERALGLVEDLLDLERLETQQPRHEVFALDVLLLRVRDRLAHQAAERDVDIVLHPHGGRFQGDEGLIEEAVVNLAANAIQAEPRGGTIELAAVAYGRRAVVSVRDHGPGVPVELRESIFGRFTQGPVRTGGSGLGLALARRIAELHGGDASVDPDTDGGARFVLRLGPMEDS
jgi:signal transduction histidine kinase